MLMEMWWGWLGKLLEEDDLVVSGEDLLCNCCPCHEGFFFFFFFHGTKKYEIN
jgi:hypothetical protein